MRTDTGRCLAANKDLIVSHLLPSPHVCRVIVGAPRANSTYSSSVQSPGAVYKCRVHSNPERRCTEMDLGRGQSPQPTASLQQDIITYIPTASLCRKDVHPHAPWTLQNEVHCLLQQSTQAGLFLQLFSSTLHQLPQASVLFYQNNAALYYFKQCGSCSFNSEPAIWRHVKDKWALCVGIHKYFDKYELCFC